MFGRRVVDDKVHYDFYAPFLASFQHRLEVVKGAVFGRDVAIIGDVVSEVALRTFVNGRNPDGVDTQPFQIIKLFQHAFQVADAVAVAVLETSGPDLVNGHFLVPTLFDIHNFTSF